MIFLNIGGCLNTHGLQHSFTSDGQSRTTLIGDNTKIAGQHQLGLGL